LLRRRSTLRAALLVLHGGYDARRDKDWTNAEWFLRHGRHWKRSREHIEQVCWSPAEIRRVLRRAVVSRLSVGSPRRPHFLRRPQSIPQAGMTLHALQISHSAIGYRSEPELRLLILGAVVHFGVRRLAAALLLPELAPAVGH